MYCLSSSGKRGFTLVEAIVVMSVIAILAGMLVPAGSYVICMAEEVRVANRAQQLGLALQLYFNDNSRFPGSYPAQLDDRLAPYLEQQLAEHFDNPEGFVNPGAPRAGAEPLNKSYVSPPKSVDPNRYVSSMKPGHPRARWGALFANQTVKLVTTLPVRYARAALVPGDVVQGGTVSFSTGSEVILSPATKARMVQSFRTGDGSSFHVVKLPRYDFGSVRVDAVNEDIVHVVTGAGVVCVRGGVADIDIVPVRIAGRSVEHRDGRRPGGRPGLRVDRRAARIVCQHTRRLRSLLAYVARPWRELECRSSGGMQR